MSTVLAANVRLVKCPKCRQLLTEYPHFDVYACGGCGTTLQAKKRSEDVKSRSSSHETEAAQRNASDLSHSIQEATGSPSRECHMHENSGRDIKENGECNEEQHGHFTLSDGEQKNQMEINKLSDLRIKEHLDSEKGCSTEAPPDSVLKGENSEAEADVSNSPLMGAEKLNNNLLLEGAEDELCCVSDGEDANNEKSAELEVTGSDSIARSSSTEKLVSDTENISNVTSHEPGKIITSVNPASVNQTISHHSFDRVRSVDAFDTTEITNPSSELSGTLGEVSKSPTTRSYHAYDGSISSYDGMDEGSPSQHLKPFDEPYTAANVVSEGRTRREKVLVNSMTYRDPETQEDSMNFTSDFPNRRHHVMEDTEKKKGKMPGTTRDNRHVLNRVRPERDYYPSRMPFHHGDPQSYDGGSPSSQLLDEYYCSSSFLSPDVFEDPDPEKVKLLRMIYKLQDQLDRTISVNGEIDGRRSIDVSCKGKYISAYHSHDLDEGRFRHSVDYPRCSGRRNHGINWPQRRNSSWMPFSAEATCSRDHVDHSCFHCRQFSTDLSPHVICQHEELCGDHNFHFPHRSCPSSPQWFIDSGLPLYSHGTKSGDRRHKTPEVKKYYREKQYLAKRHFRPVAGGAPFVTCHKCFELLQLPADFLLFKRACHLLKCGSCSEVLKFSLQNRSHIVSYAPNASGPPPSKLNDQGKEISGRILPSASANRYHNPSVDPLLYSDDDEPSAGKGYSSEDPVLHGSEYGRSDTRSTFESEKGKEKIASRHSSTSMAQEATYESIGLSSDFSGSQKLSSEKESASPAGKLHGLMGYSSPSEVIRGVQSSSAGTSSLSTENMDDLELRGEGL
ncbi:hypothetical protein L6164_029835 [Bauhinia variegata]|uniref:Uncharacterized protein n=1 Tax=Bauhinia variegata TaxID=167791 RepID=A0ACB9LAN2_BAUVA|nr:hypothetical protein L6164_029835 [Bauhinia variegata]